MARGGKRAGAGRKPGSRSRITVALAATLTATAKQYTREALQALVDVMDDRKASPAARVVAANSVLDRGWGRPLQQLEHSGRDGGPIETTSLSELELARRIAFALERGALALRKEQPDGKVD